MAKTVLITGVSSGIGRITAELMSRRGWRVAATSRDPASLGAWAREWNVSLYGLDVTDEAGIETVVSDVVRTFGGIDVLVNNAGYGVFGPIEGTTAGQIDHQFRTNVLGPLALIRHVLPAMRGRRSGTIINVSSIGGRMATPFASLYHASKFAIEGFSESFRYEAALHGIRVKLIEPAHFKTGFFTRSLQMTSHGAYDEPLRNYMEWVLKEDEQAPGPLAVAEAVLRAAEDPSPRLRYPVGGTLFLMLWRLLPDAVWRSLFAGAMRRRPKSPAGRTGAGT